MRDLPEVEIEEFETLSWGYVADVAFYILNILFIISSIVGVIALVFIVPLRLAMILMTTLICLSIAAWVNRDILLSELSFSTWVKKDNP